MGYLYLVLAALFFSFQFIFSKKYQTQTPGGGACAGGFFMYLQYLWVLLIWTAVYGTGADLFMPKTFLFAALYMAANALCTLSSLAALNTCKLSVVSLFSLIGGQMLPFFYGLLFTGAAESTGWLSWLGFAALLATCVISLPKGEDGGHGQKKWKAAFLCVGAFIGNGMVSVATDMNAKAIGAGESTSEGFMIINAVFGVLIGLCLMLSQKRRLRPLLAGKTDCVAETAPDADTAPISRKLLLSMILCAGAYAVLNGLGNVFSMLCGASAGMQSTVQYPVMNALIMMMIPMIGRVVFKEKLTARVLISAALAAVGVLLFMLDALLLGGV